jgi:hypothetical protein
MTYRNDLAYRMIVLTRKNTLIRIVTGIKIISKP